MEKDENKLKDKILKLFGEKNNRIRNFILILLMGICLFIIVWPADSDQSGFFQESGTKKTDENSAETNSPEAVGISGASVSEDLGDAYVKELEARLEEILAGVKNVGEVHVMITLKDTGETIVEKDRQVESSTNLQETQNAESEATIFTDNDGTSQPYVSKVLKPEIEGVLIACGGGGNPETVIEITEAVQALFDVPAHKIVVLELK